MARLYPEFQAKNYEILLILGAEIDKARQYVESLHLPFPVLADPTRNIYHQYGLEKLLLIQRTASILIDCNGIIQYFKRTTSPMIWLKESQELRSYLNTQVTAC